MADESASLLELSTAEQEYLESLFWLYEAGFPMTGANLARAMQLSPPTVHEMLRRLERGGWISRPSSRSIEFTADGRDRAASVVGRHRMIERFLTDVVGVPWDEVHEEAEKLEYAMTPRFETYVRGAVGDARTCPHGHPIRVHERVDGVPLADCEVGATVTILRLENEAEDLLHYLKAAGIEPGLVGRVSVNGDDEVSVTSDGGTATVTFSVAETVSVTADPSPP
jgi:DtxR family Mn-dependent transcriptional regulator